MTTPDVTPLQRRALVAGIAGAAMAGVAAHALVSAPSAAAAPVLDDPVMHLLRRATFGPTPQLLAEVRKLGTTKWLDGQLDPGSIDDAEMDAFAERLPDLRWRTWQVREKIGWDWSVMNDYLSLHSARHVWSRRQLFETVCDFWGDHFVIPAPNSEVQSSLHLWHRDVIRPHALGRFADLLKATATHPAMLSVLSNAESGKVDPNENYGRELLELHTVGVGNFSENDVRQSALALTGLSIDNESLLYSYKPQRRYLGKLALLGWSHRNDSPEYGYKVAASYLDHLARHPKTAERIARKLAIRYVSDTPPSSLVTKLAKVYLDRDTSIAPVLKALFTSGEFAASAGKKVRRPYEDAVATLRILGHRPDESGVRSMTDLRWECNKLGQLPGGCSSPAGYADDAASWSSASSTLARTNFHLAVAAQWMLKTTRLPVLRDYLPSKLPRTYADYVAVLAERLLVPGLTTAQRDAVCKFLDKSPTDVVKESDPGVRYRLGHVIALLLDTPNFALR